jgi:hypothetical protein
MQYYLSIKTIYNAKKTAAFSWDISLHAIIPFALSQYITYIYGIYIHKIKSISLQDIIHEKTGSIHSHIYM